MYVGYPRRRPKGEALSKILFESASIHARRRTLHRVQDVETGVDEVREQRLTDPQEWMKDFHMVCS